MQNQGFKHSLNRFIYRTYRALKNNLQQKKGLPTVIFFRLLGAAENVLSGHARSQGLKQEDALWRKSYAETYGSSPLFQLVTEYPVASDSADHKTPRGATHDSSTNPRFNAKVYELLGRKSGVKLLDLGCAGGGMVRSFLEDGNTAVGVEGSDIPKREQLCEWANCPLHLFTADITRPFMLRDQFGQSATFNIATAWEVLEHIPKDRLPTLIANIRDHLAPGGFFIASVDQTPDVNPLTGAVYHLTLESRDWWTQQFADQGFGECKNHPFQTCDFVRGNGLGLKDWDPGDGGGFHLVLQKI